MKVKTLIASTLLSFNLYAHEVGDTVKCQGYLERTGQERNYYELNGKILRVVGRHYMIYGYTPVFKSKRLHKVLKISCVLPDEEFIEDVVEVKEEVVEQPEIEVTRDAGIKTDEEVVVESKETAPELLEEDEEAEGIAAKPLVKPIHVKAPDEIAKKTPANEEPSLKMTPVNASEGCSNLKQRGVFQAIKCFMKDGYGSF